VRNFGKLLATLANPVAVPQTLNLCCAEPEVSAEVLSHLHSFKLANIQPFEVLTEVRKPLG
jgi:hypothetical protein